MALAAILLFSCFVLARGSAGSASDPVVTLSYLDKRFSDTVTQKVSVVWKPIADQYLKKLADTQSGLPQGADREQVIAWLAEQYIAKSGTVGFTPSFRPITLKKGDRISGGAGTGLVLRSGTAKLAGNVGQNAVNVTVGAEVNPGADIPKDQYFLLLAGNGTGFVVTSDTAVVEIDGSYRLQAAYTEQYRDLGDALFAMKFFLGTEAGYELNRSATRLEGLVMMLRLFGEEKQALAYTGTSPFTDLPAWGKPYVAYAYSKGYTNGESATVFNPEKSITAYEFMTFILRALGYADTAGGDFVWDRALDYAGQIGLFSPAEITLLSGLFYRDHIVYISYYALSGHVKGSSTLLLNKLIAQGAVSAQTATDAMNKVTRQRP
jgi:hypothetical protein